MTKLGVEAVDRIQMVRCHYLNNKLLLFQSLEKCFNMKTSENKQLYVSEGSLLQLQQ